MIILKAIKPILITGIVFCSLLSMGQNEDYDKKYTPNESSIFNNLLKKNENRYSSEIEIKNSIKFYPTMAIREKIFFSYEVDLGRGFCLGAGLGKAFGKDYLESSLFFDWSSFDKMGLTAGTLISNASYTSSQPLLALGVKIYYSGKTFDGGYVEFLYRHERMSYMLDPEVDGYRVDGPNDLIFKMNAAYFGFGFTGTSGEKNNFTHDFYIQLGIKNFKYTEYETMTVAIGPYNSENICRQAGTLGSARILPAINIGYAFGFGF
jgi:hypothetical protein